MTPRRAGGPEADVAARRVGRMLRTRRAALGLTQEQLGELLGVPFNTISRWELGLLMPLHPRLLDLALSHLELLATHPEFGPPAVPLPPSAPAPVVERVLTGAKWRAVQAVKEVFGEALAELGATADNTSNQPTEAGDAETTSSPDRARAPGRGVGAQRNG